MSTNADETDNSTAGEPVLDRKGTNYAYLGRDAEGDHHHHDKRDNRIVVATAGYEDYVPDGDVRYFYRVWGDVTYVEDLDEAPPKDIDHWVSHVAKKRGWASRPDSVADALATALDDLQLGV